MIKIKASYSSEQEKEKFVEGLKNTFQVFKVSKEYRKSGSYKRIHIDLENKN